MIKINNRIERSRISNNQKYVRYMENLGHDFNFFKIIIISGWETLSS